MDGNFIWASYDTRKPSAPHVDRRADCAALFWGVGGRCGSDNVEMVVSARGGKSD
jgi:hypothetical protein